MVHRLLENKKVLMVFAHCDDEIICGWPIFQEKSIEKKILITSSDLKNKKRKWCRHRKNVFFEVCDQYAVEGHCLDYNSDFYMLETRKESLTNMQIDICEKIRSMGEFDYIFCHNPLGEYGHLDHKMIFDIVINNFDIPVLITDISIKTNWPSHNNCIPKHLQRIYYQNQIATCNADMEIYNHVQQIYENHKVWTWSTPAVKECNLYLLNP